MKFLVTRTSDYSDETQPIEEARLVETTHIDRRTVKTLEEAKNAHWGTYFFASGKNHREENGMVARDMDKKYSDWEIEITNLRQLIGIIKKYGEIIISSSNVKGYEYEIEIYDGYRE